jgi:type IV pilus biogenesis protein CpaD/CtpE
VPTTSLLVVVIALVAAACADPEQPVQAPARHDTAEPSDPAACKRLSRRLVGRSLEEAQSMAREARCALRVVSQDGQDLPVTEDFSHSRINVRVESGQVTEVAGLF